MKGVYKFWDGQETNYLINSYNDFVLAKEIAKKLGRNVGSVERKIRTLESNGQIMSRGRGNYGRSIAKDFTPTPEPSYIEDLHIEGDAIICSDTHVPFWNEKLFGYMFKIAKKFLPNKKRQLILDGDFINLDSFSRWITGFRGRENTEREMNIATYVLDKCLEVFDKIYWIQGNHEDRLMAQLGGQISAKRFLRMFTTAKQEKHIVFSDYPFCTLNKTYKIVHPKNYGDRGGQVPADLADKYDCHIISGHNHQFGMQLSKNGKWIGADHGMSGDPEKIEYHQKNITRNRTWQIGFSMVKNNYLYLFNLYQTDWNFWLNKLKL